MKKFTHLILIGLVYALSFALPVAISANGNVYPSLEKASSCNLPAPTGLILTNVTSNSVEAQWNAVPGAVEYYIEALDANTQQLYYSNTVGNLDEVCTNLPPNTLIEVKVYASCGNGNISNLYAREVTRTDIVIELVVNGRAACEDPGPTITPVFNPLTQSYDYSITTNVDYDGIVSTQQNGAIGAFSLFINNNGNNKTAVFKDDRVNYDAYLDEVKGSTNRVKMMLDNEICRFKVYAPNPTSNNIILAQSGLGAPYTFTLSTCNGRSGGEKRSSDEEGVKVLAGEEQLLVAPNPFGDLLYLQTNFDGEAVTEILQMDGTMLRSQMVSVKSGAVLELETSDLQAGMYVIRVIHSNKVYAKKVVKTN